MLGLYLSARTDAFPPAVAGQERATADHAALTRLRYVGHGGIVRGKAAAAARPAERTEPGIGHTWAMLAIPMMDELAPVEGMGPTAVARGPFSMGQSRSSPPRDMNFRRRLSQNSVSDVTKAHHSCPLTKASVTLLPVSPGARLYDRPRRCAAQTGSRGRHYYPELGRGQQEVPIRHMSALRAADNHVLLRETARAVAIKHGLWAGFAPMPLRSTAYLAVKRSEVEHFRGHDVDYECRPHWLKLQGEREATSRSVWSWLLGWLFETPPARDSLLYVVVAPCPRGVVVAAGARVGDQTRAGASGGSSAGAERVDALTVSTGPESGLQRRSDDGQRRSDIL